MKTAIVSLTLALSILGSNVPAYAVEPTPIVISAAADDSLFGRLDDAKEIKEELDSNPMYERIFSFLFKFGLDRYESHVEPMLELDSSDPELPLITKIGMGLRSFFQPY